MVTLLDLMFAQETFISGQFDLNWKLRVMAQEAALKEMARSKLRRQLAHDRSFNRADAEVGDSVLLYKAVNR